MTKFLDRGYGANKLRSMVTSFSMLIAIIATSKNMAKRARGTPVIALSDLCGRFSKPNGNEVL
ncbi:MAG: hypothetical protein HQK58_16095 [Deltaproteobacteria bacterium]|nr:hypothetical protein [Deltaproteobacteria bacterium]